MSIEYRKNRSPEEMKKLAAWHYLIDQGNKPRDAARTLEDADFSEDVTEFDSCRSYSTVIATKSKALEQAESYIRDSLWAFNASFLSDFCDLPSEVFEAIQANDKCEGNNDTIETLIERSPGGLSQFVEDAIRADDIGHYLNSYDGKSEEIIAGGETFIIWKQ